MRPIINVNISKTHARILAALLAIIVVGITADYASSAGAGLVQWHTLSEISADGGATSIDSTLNIPSKGNVTITGNLSITGGNIGIGTTSPGQKLTVVGDVSWTGILQGGSVPWARLTGIPTGFADGVDNIGIASETDPTVPASVKDGVSWGEVSGRPAFNGCSGANLALKTLDLNTGAATCETDDVGGGISCETKSTSASVVGGGQVAFLVNCAAGEKVTGCGVDGSAGGRIISVYPSGNGCSCSIANTVGFAENYECYAVCCW